MKLWLLRPVTDWVPCFDCNFGFVVRAVSEDDARRLVEGCFGDEPEKAWLNQALTTCSELLTLGDAEVVIRDFRSA